MIGFMDNTGSVTQYLKPLIENLSIQVPESSFLYWGPACFGKRGNIFCFSGPFHIWPTLKIMKLLNIIIGLPMFLLMCKRNGITTLNIQWLQIPLYLIFLNYFFGFRIVYTVHNTNPSHGYRSIYTSVLNAGFTLLLEKAQSIVVLSEYSKRVLTDEFGVVQEKIFVIEHGSVSLISKTRSVNRRRFCEDGVLRILCFGVIADYKNIIEILVAADKVAKEVNIDCALRVAGRPGLGFEKISRFIESYSGDVRVDFEVGFVTNERVDEIFSEADIIMAVYTSTDASGLVSSVIGLRKVLIGSNRGGMREYLDDGRDCLLSGCSSSEIVSCILKLVEQRGLATRLRQGLHRKVMRGSLWTDVAAAYCAVFFDG